jgi:putative hydrolase of the HAD superfamily
MLRRWSVSPDEFVMVGNSLPSDVLPVVEVGGRAVHIPYAVTWGHEVIEPQTSNGSWVELGSISELAGHVAGLH